MVRIRLRRVGAKKQASYRVVVTDSRSPRDGRFIERLGWYNPRTDPPSFEIKQDRALYWLSVGAQPSEAVARLLKKMGALEKFERVKAGASIEEVLAEAVEAETTDAAEATVAAIIEEALPTEEEIAAEEPADEADETEESETEESTKESIEADEALEETGGEEEGKAA